MKSRGKRKELIGIVVSDKMEKTIIIRVERLAKHVLYKKMVKRYSKYKVHDEENQAKVGQRVKIMETRPVSKEKRWRLVEVLS